VKYSIKPLLQASLPLYAILLGSVWFLSPEFLACSKDSVWCSVFYWITESAGRAGTPLIVLAAGIFYAINAPSAGAKAKAFFRTFLVLFIILFVFAFVNEYGIKPALQRARPSHTYILEQTHSTARLDSIYTLPESDRRIFFQQLIQSDTLSFGKIDKRVLDHWIYEAGSSFPSGHSFNAFLLASILAFSIYYSGTRIKWFYSLPLIWAVLVGFSRVALGVHSALDVSAGAALGLIVSHTLLSFSVTQKLLIPNKRPDLHTP